MARHFALSHYSDPDDDRVFGLPGRLVFCLCAVGAWSIVIAVAFGVRALL